MSQKTTGMVKPSGGKTRHRKRLTLKQKLELVRLSDAGVRVTDIARRMNLANSTVHTILRSAEKIRSSSASAMNAKYLAGNRNPIMVDMERMLLSWISDQMEKNAPLHTQAIQEMARTIYEDLKREYGEDSSLVEPFKASAGWFERFKRRAKISSATLKSVLTEDTGGGASWLTGETADFIVPIEQLSEGGGGTSREGGEEKYSNETSAIARDIVDAVEVIGEALYALHERDPDKERSALVCDTVSRALDCYAEYFRVVPLQETVVE